MWHLSGIDQLCLLIPWETGSRHLVCLLVLQMKTQINTFKSRIFSSDALKWWLYTQMRIILSQIVRRTWLSERPSGSRTDQSITRSIFVLVPLVTGPTLSAFVPHVKGAACAARGSPALRHCRLQPALLITLSGLSRMEKFIWNQGALLKKEEKSPWFKRKIGSPQSVGRSMFWEVGSCQGESLYTMYISITRCVLSERETFKTVCMAGVSSSSCL